MRHTMWGRGHAAWCVTPPGPHQASDITLGSAFHVIPRTSRASATKGYLDEKAKAVVSSCVWTRTRSTSPRDRKDWNVDGVSPTPRSARGLPHRPVRAAHAPPCCARATSPRSTSRTSVRLSSARHPPLPQLPFPLIRRLPRCP
ncbi:hypothetical protein QJS66_03490 [Kocuria rhizophila]|nr:hypothetical protein QJS66_03490 [Kocuria rhizophila]